MQLIPILYFVQTLTVTLSRIRKWPWSKWSQCILMSLVFVDMTSFLNLNSR